MKLLTATTFSWIPIIAHAQILTWKRPFDYFDSCGDLCSNEAKTKNADKIKVIPGMFDDKKGYGTKDKITIGVSGLVIPAACEDCLNPMLKCPDGITEGDPCGSPCCGEDCDPESCDTECLACPPELSWWDGAVCIDVQGKKWTEFWCNDLTSPPTPQPTPKPSRAPVPTTSVPTINPELTLPPLPPYADGHK